MPGLVGLTVGTLGDTARSAVNQMSRLITHLPFHIAESAFCNRDVCAARVNTGVIQTSPQPASAREVHVWIDGEFYNQPQLVGDVRGPVGAKHTDAELLRDLYASDKSLSFLDRIDGIYSAVIFDAAQRVIYLITDRYGLRHLYWLLTKNGLCWASEVKAFLAAPNFAAEIDDHSVHDFFSIGHLIENRTWFRDITLLGPGSVLKFDINSQRHEITTYWSWERIRPLPSATEEDQIIEELSRLFRGAVDRQSQASVPVGVSLSGGSIPELCWRLCLPETKHPIFMR